MGFFSLGRRTRALSDQPARSRTSGSGCLIVFGLVFGAFHSIVAVLVFFMPLTRALNAETWVEVPCTILESRVGESRGDDGTTYRVEVRYEYHFRAGDLESDPSAPRYESERYDFMEGVYSSNAAEKQAVVAQLAPGTRTTCWVDPRAPEEAVLKSGFPDDLRIGLFTLIVPLVCFALVVGGIVSAIRGRRRAATAQSLAAGVPFVPLPTVSNDGAGPVELQPAKGRLTKLISIGLFAAIWNGIIWTILIAGNVLAGNVAEWFPLLILSIFVLIGLGLLVMVLHQLLALGNPRLRLIVNRRAFRPGEVLELEWECSGNPSRITTLTIALEGRESATYTRGTNTITESHVFARLPLATLDDTVAILGGRTKVALPTETVPTVIAPHNKLEWILTVRGAIPRWPDISDDYDVTILPARSTP